MLIFQSTPCMLRAPLYLLKSVNRCDYRIKRVYPRSMEGCINQTRVVQFFFESTDLYMSLKDINILRSTHW